MRKFKNILSFVLLPCVLLSAVFTGGGVSAETPTDTLQGAPSASNGAVTSAGNSTLSFSSYKFTEDFSGDLSKWSDAYFKDGYTSDFEIVTDPDDEANKVLTFTKESVFKVIADEYWPCDGQMSHITFKAKFKNESFSNYASAMTFSLKDGENFDGTYYYSDYSDTHGLFFRYFSYIEGAETGRRSGTPSCTTIAKTEWLTYDVAFTDAKITITTSDESGNVITTVMTNHFPTGRYAIGAMDLYQANGDIGGGGYYIDDITVDFKELSVDIDDEIKDVEVYYSGNTFYEPGDTVSITGEKLGQTVASAELLIIDNSDAQASNINYLTEQDYSSAVDTQSLSWEEIKAKSSNSPTELDIIQRSTIGVKFEIPETVQKGIYAVHLTAAADGGKDAVVFINNPVIDFLSGDDGEAATPGGYIKIAGNNLSVQNDTSVLSAVITDSKGNKTEIENSDIFAYTSSNNTLTGNEGKANDYYIEVTLPEDIAVGDYTVTLHNGYGGTLGWSAPKEFSVKENSDRAEWSDNAFYNVKDYGALGDYTYGNTTRDANTNDTAGIISALAAAAETGGTVYFPKGFYRVTDTLYIPDNVTLLGEENYQSGIFFDDVGWITPPEALIYYGNNIEFKNLYLYGGFTRTIFKQKDTLANSESHIYFNNVRCLFDPSISCSNNGRAALMEGYTYLEAQVYIKELSNTYPYRYLTNSVAPEYLEANNFDIFYATGYTSGDSVLSFSGEYINVYDSEWEGFSNAGASVAGFIDNCTWDGCLAWGGNTMYTNCNGGNGTNNNREIFTCDGHARDSNSIVQNMNNVDWSDETAVKKLMGDEYSDSATLTAVKQLALANQGLVYRVTNTRVYQSGSYANSYKYLYVHNGQGMGQVRAITRIEQIGNYSYLVLDTPFAVEPNRNSRVYFHSLRTDMYCVSNNFYNGRHTGTFGTAVDAVFDGITMRESASGVELHLCQSGVWYVTCREIDSDDIVTGRTNILYNEAMSLLSNGGTPITMAFAGIQWRDNNIGDCGYMTGNYSGAESYGMIEIIIEDNHFETDSVDGIQGFTKTSLSVEGLYFNDNTQLMENGETTDPYSSETVSAIRAGAKNKFNSYRIMCDDISATADKAREYGDVNDDGRISIKDVTVLRYYFTGQYTPTEKVATFEKYADANRDGSVNTLDIFAIFCKILGKEYNGETSGGSSGGSGSQVTPETPSPDAPSKTTVSDEIELDYSGVLEDGETPVVDDGTKDGTDLDYDSVTPQD